MTRVTDDRALWLARNVLPHEPWLRGLLERKYSLGIDVDDIVQEAYAHLIELDRVDGIRDPRAYLAQVARNLIVSRYRRARIVSIEMMAELDQLDMPDEAPLPDQQVASRQELRAVAGAIAALPPRCREVFVLRKVEGLSQRDAAQRLGVAESTIEKQLGRGVRRLMDIFGRGGKAPAHASSQQDLDLRSAPDPSIARGAVEGTSE